MITKEQLQAMSDFQRNVKLFELLGGRACSLKEGGDGNIVFENGCTINYHNTPNDIMPLQIEHKVNILWHPDKRKWMAMNFYGDYFDKNLLRAIACCLILVLQEKQK